MAQVPDDQGTAGMDRRGGRIRVEEAAGAVVDVREQDEGDLVGEGRREAGGDLGVVDEANLAAGAALRGQAFEHVDVGGEVLPLGEDDPAAGGVRSEERRVGKEWRARRWTEPQEEKN